ncbi:MAG: hypothetical protein ABII25_04390, partial [bacterium]
EKTEVKEEVRENLVDKAIEIEAEEQAKQEEMALLLEAEREEIAKISLTGVVLLDGRRTAILDRKILREGDVIGGKKIIGIEKNRVILSSKGREYTVELQGEKR